MKKVVRSKIVTDNRKTHKPVVRKKPVLAKDMPPRKGDNKPVNPKNPKGPKWGELFGRKPAGPAVRAAIKAQVDDAKAKKIGKKAKKTKPEEAYPKTHPSSSRRAGAGARRAASTGGWKSEVKADTTKKVVPNKAAKPTRFKAGAAVAEPKPKRVRKPPKEVKVFATWVIFDNKLKRVETFPYSDKVAAERCLKRMLLRDGKDSHHLRMVKEREDGK